MDPTLSADGIPSQQQRRGQGGSISVIRDLGHDCATVRAHFAAERLTGGVWKRSASTCSSGVRRAALRPHCDPCRGAQRGLRIEIESAPWQRE
jgi:hypothetical protein